MFRKSISFFNLSYRRTAVRFNATGKHNQEDAPNHTVLSNIWVKQVSMVVRNTR